MRFEDAIFDSEFFSGSEIRELRVFRDNDGGVSLRLRIHWWKEAAEEFQAGFPGYNRTGDGHRILSYEFRDLSDVDLKGFSCSNGDMIDRVLYSDGELRKWEFQLAAGKFLFRASSVEFLSVEKCSDFGFALDTDSTETESEQNESLDPKSDPR